MNDMKDLKNLSKSLYKSIIVGIVLVVVLFSAYLFFISALLQDYDVATFNEGWRISLNDKICINKTNLLKFELPQPMKKGDVMILENTIPDDAAKYPMLQLLIYYAEVDVFINDNLIYTYGHDRAEEGKFLGVGYHWIEIPNDAAGQQVTVKLTAAENNVISSIDSICLDTSSNVFTAFIRKNVESIKICIFLMMFGFISFAVAAPLVACSKEFSGFACLGVFALFIGAWILCNYNIIQLVSPVLWVNTCIEYISLYLTPLPLLLFFSYNKVKNQRFKKITTIVWIVNIIFIAVSVTLHITNTIHYCSTLTFFHIILLADVACVVYGATIGAMSKNKTLSERFMHIGMVVLAIFVIGDIFRYNYQRYINTVFLSGTTSLVPIGALIFVICLIVSYCLHAFDAIYEKTENEFLSKLAYYDCLTEINNRTRCEIELADLQNSDNDYAVVNFDLNNLKVVNDTLGHIYGDRLIKSFAEMLSSCFGDVGTVGRMGGDEFVVILKNVSKSWLEERLAILSNTIKQANAKSENQNVQVSVSYGYAFSSEVDSRDSKKVYNLADERMYIMKGMMK